jgi:hypothetical protein
MAIHASITVNVEHILRDLTDPADLARLALLALDHAAARFEDLGAIDKAKALNAGRAKLVAEAITEAFPHGGQK